MHLERELFHFAASLTHQVHSPMLMIGLKLRQRISPVSRMVEIMLLVSRFQILSHIVFFIVELAYNCSLYPSALKKNSIVRYNYILAHVPEMTRCIAGSNHVSPFWSRFGAYTEPCVPEMTGCIAGSKHMSSVWPGVVRILSSVYLS